MAVALFAVAGDSGELTQRHPGVAQIVSDHVATNLVDQVGEAGAFTARRRCSVRGCMAKCAAIGSSASSPSANRRRMIWRTGWDSSALSVGASVSGADRTTACTALSDESGWVRVKYQDEAGE